MPALGQATPGFSDESIAPLVSIIMGVYNAESTIEEALESIALQSLTDWEIVLCDDGSTDASYSLCEEFARKHPARVRLLRNSSNLKLAKTLNRCLLAARGKYIARMDADDISLPDRLASQVQALQANPRVDLVGTAMRRFDESGLGTFVIAPEFPSRDSLRTIKPFNHATIVARQQVFWTLGGYDESTRAERVEDYDLWFRFYAHGFVGVNLQSALYLVREDSSAFRRRTARARMNEFATALIGFRRLGYPLASYVFPVLNLSKILVPAPIMRHLHRLGKR